MTARIKIPAADLRKLLRYEPETGKLFWLPRTPDMFSDGKHTAEHSCAKWNARYAGQEALTTSVRGYLYGRLAGSALAAHHAAWAMAVGRWPSQNIDHINGVRSDNRSHNLREATTEQNARNSHIPRGGSSRFRGVCWDARRSCWRASIRYDKRKVHIGSFATEEDAARAYDRVAVQHHGPFASVNFEVPHA